MEAAATTSSSKVIVQCTDPFNVIDAFRESFEPRTPLKNLHWKSPSRPLRSIPSLNVSLSRNDAAQNGAQLNARRHQIPGLRETPYVKLYLLRCDDKETYKETARKEIKQWIRENTFEKESKSVLKNQEHHDAFEWMIVHVVFPGTQASSQPQSSKHISLNDTESTDSVNSKSKWTGKASSTIHDKLRADFSSSKLPIPRVAQVRLLDPAKPPGALGPTDIEEQWRDFVDNLKASILKSFDTRVAQYEEDIREREAQRSLPGWNFCTFFILKEGLARGFENVGLLEDALAVYAELEVGLDAVVQQSRAPSENDVGGALLPYSQHLKPLIRKALDEEVDDMSGETSTLQLDELLAQGRSTSPFEPGSRHYRDMILANDVSPLDIRTYIFTRQMEILLRRAKSANFGAKTPAIDLEIMADLADLGLDFINLASRELHMDVQAAWGGRLSGEERATQKVVIGNVVASWTWAATVQILHLLLPHLDVDLTHLEEFNVLEEDRQLSKPQKSHKPNGSVPSSRGASPVRGLRPESLSSSVSLQQTAEHQSRTTKQLRRPGLDRLCSTIAKLFLLLRKTVENLLATSEWVEAIRRTPPTDRGDSNRIHMHRLSSGLNLPITNGDDSHSHLPDAVLRYRLRALTPEYLKKATSSQDAFHSLYRLLSTAMHHLYFEANSKHSARQVLIDLAMLAFAQHDLAFTRQCLSNVLEDDSDEPLISSQPQVISIYAECLRAEERTDDLARCLIELMNSPLASRSAKLAQQYCEELLSLASHVSPTNISLDTLVKVVSVDRNISHTSAAGGFTWSLTLLSAVPGELKADSVSVSFKSANHSEPLELVAKTEDTIVLNSSPVTLNLQSNTLATGWFNAAELEVQIGKIHLTRNFAHSESARSVTSYKPMLVASDAKPLLVYPGRDAPKLSVSQSNVIDLEHHARALHLDIQTRDFELDDYRLHVRPATAGLRLKLLDAKVVSGTEGDALKVQHDHAGTVLKLGRLPSSTIVQIEIPYSLENQTESTVLLKCVMDYRQGEDSFSIYHSCSAQVLLPLAVSVQDIHRSGYRYSTFLIATATPSPLVLVNCQIDGSAGVAARSSAEAMKGITVFNQQPARWLVHSEETDAHASTKPSLKLAISYYRIDEVALACLERSFRASAQAAGFEAVADLLVDHIIATYRQIWIENELEVISLTREIAKKPKTELDWQQILPAFPRQLRHSIDEWLTGWHSDGQVIPMDLDNGPVRELRLKADVQPPPPLVTTTLDIHLPVTQATAVLGHPLLCTLSIAVPRIPLTDRAQLTYELFAQSDTWLIGGRKKGTIHCTGEAVEESQSITLFPQRSGRLLVPSIEVRIRKGDENGAHGGQEGAEIAIEVHNRSISTSVHVTPGLRSSTIGLMATSATGGSGDGAPAATALLLQSQMR
ncbi:Trafficking protein particle complex subunit 10 [Cyphellophora attinorum]|uniref:Trafficking protein particle complex subunit 10 n=1 Tax=Cyphellophora attinorum TaxID=1664694 RepID=A0A0N1H446_9EURO|nr:Trafficking protein particle complex subunit 10 [Phialophora attinorum]KPI36682.1 Trafficking protein particle complex subunit 10 [Phialophora attinorum]